MKYYIKTFGCQQNIADSERIVAAFSSRGIIETNSHTKANYVIINTCMVRQSAENRVYGLVQNLKKIKQKKTEKKEFFKIIVTGCIVGMALRDKTGKYLQRIRGLMPDVDEFMPIEEVGFDNEPIRQDTISASVPISNGCNNFCTYCVVPFTRGREISRPFQEIIKECLELKKSGYKNITLLGQNVNSYGADLILAKIPDSSQSPRAPHQKVSVGEKQISSVIKNIKPTYVKHLGRYRIPTVFPHLLKEVAKLGFEKVDFMSSNPWDFSDELIDIIAQYSNITRAIHLPIQSGDDNVLKRMNRWYTSGEYLSLVSKLKLKIKDLKLTTDIIVGFCGETDKEFNNTVETIKKAGFEKAYIAMYSPRPLTTATNNFLNDVSHAVKKKRWQILEDFINKPHLDIINHASKHTS